MSNQKSSWETPARNLAAGIGMAVAARTILRKKKDGSLEDWGDVAHRVARGNTMLRPSDAGHEFESLHRHLRKASVLMSGRHLQHGDETQPSRNIEVYSNCSTSASTFILFYLLLNGSGVGRAYDDDMMLVDWSQNMPRVVPCIHKTHPDVISGEIGEEFWNLSVPKDGLVEFFKVPDSREGWAKAIEKIEFMTWEGTHAETTLMIDFGDVRERNQPIRGMQNRPASGPGPLMDSIKQIAALRGSGMAPWKATMHADHYASECVRVGGARRAARMATKTWRDSSVFEFISVKRGGNLWSSNNSVTVDELFWGSVKKVDRLLRRRSAKSKGVTVDTLRGHLSKERVYKTDVPNISDLELHAYRVFIAVCEASYHDGTGEPGLINVERLRQTNEGVEALFDGNYAESDRFALDEDTKRMTAELAKVFSRKEFTQITNPCGEITLTMIGGYCVIADVVPYHAGTFDWRFGKEQSYSEIRAQATAWDDEAEDAFRTATRALIRTNTMNALYQKEVNRTNRIGVGFTGLHEYAWARFGFGWKDIVNEKKSIDFWRTMGRFSRAVSDEAKRYSKELGVAEPHTALTVKPAGTTSKLFGLTEGAHLPSMREYLRWVQFRNGDPLISEYAARGYPVRELKVYAGTTIVGFPTVPEIVKLGMGELLVTASEATPEEQYEYLRLLEKWWIDGRDNNDTAGHGMGNQVSYTLKYKPQVTSFEEFCRTLLDGQSTIKCCSVMPESDTSAYEYLPETPVSKEEFAAIVNGLSDNSIREEIGVEHMECAGGACPIEWKEESEGA